MGFGFSYIYILRLYPFIKYIIFIYNAVISKQYTVIDQYRNISLSKPNRNGLGYEMDSFALNPPIPLKKNSKIISLNCLRLFPYAPLHLHIWYFV